MEDKFTLTDWLVALGFVMAIISLGIGLRYMVYGKNRTKENTKPSLNSSVSEPYLIKQ